MFIQTNSGVTGECTAPMVAQSELPALWGLRSLRNLCALIDFHGEKVIFVGAGGYSIDLSPGSTVHAPERARSGHLLLPVTVYTQSDGHSLLVLVLSLSLSLSLSLLLLLLSQ